MRDILFRGTRKDNAEWVYGYYEFYNGGHYINIQTDRVNSGGYPIREFIKVIPETVGQYTGLTDKNGKRIFEGDIVKGENWLHKDHCIHRVVFNEGGFYFIDKDGDPWHHDHINDFEIIGNIHDNPELLEVNQ